MTYKLITAPNTEPVTLAQAKLHCRVDGSDDDARITAMISASRKLAEQKTGSALAPQTWELVLDSFPVYFTVNNGPLTAVSSLKYLDTAGVEQTLNSANYVVDLDSNPGRVTLAEGASWPETSTKTNAVRLRYTCGYAIDDGALVALRQWMLIAIGTWYRHSEAVDAINLAELPRTYVDGLLDCYKVSFL